MRTDSNQPKPSPANPNFSKERQLGIAVLLREVRDGMAPITRRLSAAGFGDIHDDELLILLALGMAKKNVGSLLRAANIAEQAVGSITETLLSRGYLERKGNPGEPEQESMVLSKRAATACNVVTDEMRVQRWARFPFRQGDLVICAQPKSGTTWVQMICALLIFQTPDLPAPIRQLSPWLDDLHDARDTLFAQLAAQEHRRFIKTHLSLDKVAIDPRVTYIVVARHPLDVMISFHRVAALGSRHGVGNSTPTLRERLLSGISEKDPENGLPGMMRALSAAWARRGEPNVALLRYEDLAADLGGEMRGLAARLVITVPETAWPGLVEAATFDQMRAAADRIQPLRDLKDQAQFFWKGKPGSGRALVTGDDLARYDERAAQLAPADLLAWLNN